MDLLIHQSHIQKDDPNKNKPLLFQDFKSLLILNINEQINNLLIFLNYYNLSL